MRIGVVAVCPSAGHDREQILEIPIHSADGSPSSAPHPSSPASEEAQAIPGIVSMETVCGTRPRPQCQASKPQAMWSRAEASPTLLSPPSPAQYPLSASMSAVLYEPETAPQPINPDR
ncbi:hypothetical protein AOLI_G00094390 [Acnodon oligacanthus]